MKLRIVEVFADVTCPFTHVGLRRLVEVLRERVAPDLFRGFDPAHLPATTIPALALGAAADRRGDRIGEAASLALRTALFEEGRDIASPDELTSIARSIGLDSDHRSAEAVVHGDWHDGERRGVVGSAHFFIDGEGFFCPMLDIERVDGRLQIDVGRAPYAAFIATVFGEDDGDA